MVVTNNRQANKIYEELEGYKKKLIRAEAIYADSETTDKPEGTRPTDKTGFLGLCGEKVDSIEYYNEKTKELLPKQNVVYVIVALTIFFYMIPIGFISAFTTLANLRKQLPFLKVIVDQAAIKTVLEAYLPQIALIVFLAVLPKFLMFLSKTEGIPSQSHIERAASGKYFYFSVLNVFIGVTVGGTLFSTFKLIKKDPNSVIRILAYSLPGNATFFLTYVALK
ncbi:hypothetical protein CRG98_011679 [Punica granatum]|uniref:CSC1/OSCA1-like 7TM region domain-containing protein n=1 Tax=Punica granatum TaxID=22663 RepID=A0A2I0KIS5_PUNGR|nr:hypothetical protein CRG98_011679 [Punica granatum]